MIRRDSIQALADEIAARFPAVERVILFGSHAYGTPREHSDVDLVVLMDFEDRGAGLARDPGWAIDRAVPRSFPRDILVYRPSDFERRYREFDPIPRMAADHGVVLYEREAAGERDRAAVA